VDSPIPTRIVPSVSPADATPRQVAHEFRRRVDDGMPIRPAGEARSDPSRLLSLGYTPRYRIALFDTTYYLTRVRQNDDIRFFVAYVVQPSPRGREQAFPRIFYKDVSLIWRSASHFIRSDDENWIGKGDLRLVVEGDLEYRESAEETTDLPFEIQPALEGLIRTPGKIPRDEKAIALVLRRGHDQRVAPYRDFTEPRRRAQADRRNLIHGGRRIAWFARRKDPTSLKFAAGYEPDFARGLLESDDLRSKLYGGDVRRFRILSRNRRIQYLFMAGPRHVWIIPPQATTTDLSSFGVRTIDVLADEELCIPGYEYHFVDDDEDPPKLVSQIPEGYAGAPNPVDPDRADASRWLERLPVVREFRRRVLKRTRGRAG
jgi:hypothetical protein